MKNYSFLLLPFCCTLFFTACSDDDEETPSREEMLQGKRWQITSLEAASFDLYTRLLNCQKDNTLEFRDNGVLIMDEGTTKCQASMPQQIPGTWTLNGDVLTLGSIGASFGLPVNDLVVTITDQTSSNITAKFDTTLPGIPFPVSGTVTLKVM